MINPSTDRGALADDIEGALVNSEGKDFLMDAGFAREVIGALRAGQAEPVAWVDRSQAHGWPSFFSAEYVREYKVDTSKMTPLCAALAEPAPHPHSVADVKVNLIDTLMEPCKGCGKRPVDFTQAAPEEAPSEAVRLAQEVIGNAKHMTEVDARLILAREVLQLRHEIEVLHHERVGPAPSEADGYIVTLNDSASAPGGFWFVGAYHSREIAESLRSRTKASSVRPFRFTDAPGYVDCRKLVEDLASHGTRFDLNPTLNYGGTVWDVGGEWTEYVKRIDTSIRERAKEALAAAPEAKP
jgi:hypothetical protein